MKKRIRISIRIKIAIMSMITIAVAVTTLGVFLSFTFANTAYQTAAATLESTTNNATSALHNSVQSTITSMNLLANQIGYNYEFANNIVKCSTSEEAKKNVQTAMVGINGTGDGSSIIGAMDYLVISDAEIESATMYSPYVDSPIYSRLLPANESIIPFNETNYDSLLQKPWEALWFFDEEISKENIYIWKSIANFAAEDSDDIQVVGFIEYTLNINQLFLCLTETKYQDEGMLLYDAYGSLMLSVSCGEADVDELVMNKGLNYSYGERFRADKYTLIRSDLEEPFTYITFINHKSIDETNRNSMILTASIVGVSIIVAALVAILLAARELSRITKLSKAAGDISNGDYSVRVKEVSNDEITDVSKSFNAMAATVQETLKALILQQDSISENFATILSNKSGESGNHVKRVSEYSAILAEEFGFSENEIHDIRIASMLHDVGKIMVDENILHKPGRFTDEEFKIMQQHVVYGGQLLQGVPGNIMQLGAIIAQYHHERWDGTGYVKHLKGDEIPKEAQIASVADVFDALVSKRCYKDAWTIEQAYDEIVAQKGKQFSPAAVDAFIKRFEDFKHIAEHYKD